MKWAGRRNRLKKDINPLGKEIEYFYDTASNVTAVDDAENDRTEYEYNALSLRTAVITPLDFRSEIYYDAIGNVTGTRDANDFLTTYEYNARNERVKMTDAENFETEWEYDGAGNMTLWTDAVGNETEFEYEERNLVSTKTDPNGKESTYEYDDAGQLTEVIDRLGRKREFEYDENGRVITEEWYTGTTLDETLSWTYDANGNVLTADNAHGGYTLTYDKINQVKTAEDVWGKTLTMTYDGNGNRTKRTDSDDGVQDHTYDAANRVTKITHSGTGQTPLRVDLTYTDDNRTDTITRYSDLAGTTKTGSSDYDYDDDGRLTDLQHLDGSDANIADYDFEYDDGNRLTSETLNSTTKDYEYDDTNQLTDDNGVSHSYDGTGNRTNTGYSTGTGNRITSDGTWTYTHDDEGNITKKSKGAQDETWTYGYNHKNEMVWAEKRETDGGTLELRADYKYDVNGNRIEKLVDDDGDTNVDLTERYAYDGYKPGNGFVGNENWDIWADLDDTNSLTTRYLRGDLIDQLFAQDDGSTTNWLLPDHIGTIRNVTDSSGANKNTITYSGFGEITNQSDPNYSSRYTYASREYDAETKFTYNRARYYSPEIGRWTSEDPLGFGAGDSNLFRYVTNQPTTNTDPSGLDLRQTLSDPTIPNNIFKGLGRIAVGPFIGLYMDNKSAVDGAVDNAFNKAISIGRQISDDTGYTKGLKRTSHILEKSLTGKKRNLIEKVPQAIEMGRGIFDGVVKGFREQGEAMWGLAKEALTNISGLVQKVSTEVTKLINQIKKDFNGGNFASLGNQAAKLALGSIYDLITQWSQKSYRGKGELVGRVIAEFAPDLVLSAASGGAGAVVSRVFNRARLVVTKLATTIRRAGRGADLIGSARTMDRLRRAGRRRFGAQLQQPGRTNRPNFTDSNAVDDILGGGCFIAGTQTVAGVVFEKPPENGGDGDSSIAWLNTYLVLAAVSATVTIGYGFWQRRRQTSQRNRLLSRY